MAISKNEMNFSLPYQPKKTSRSTSVPGTSETPTQNLRGVDKTIPLRKVINSDTETLATSQPLGTDILSGAAKALSAGIGRFSYTTIILVVLAAAVGYLLIRKKGR